MTMQYYPSNPYNPLASPGGGYDFGYGGRSYEWDPRAGYVPQVGGYGNPYGNLPPIVNQYVPTPRPPQPVGQQYINTAQSAAPVAKVAPVQAPEDYLKDHQQIVGGKVIGTEAPNRLWERIRTGVHDWWDPTQDRDQRGGVWVEDPLVPKSKGMYVKVDPETGYGGTVEDMIANAPKKPQPKPPEADKQPNQPLPDDPRTTATGQLKHLGMNTVLGKVHQYLDNDTLQRANDRAFNNYIRTKQWLDPNTINFLTAQQMTPYGKSKLLNEATDRTATLTGAATDAATRKKELREGLLAMKQGTALTNVGWNRAHNPAITSAGVR